MASNMWKQLNHHKLAVVIAIAVLARLAVLLMLPDVFAYSEPGGEIHGSIAYDDYAQNLLATGVYGRSAGLPDASLPPLYSLVLAAIYGVFGRSYLAVALWHIVFDALSIALLADICRRLLDNPPRFPRQVRGKRHPSLADGGHGAAVGALAGLFFALYPYLIFQNLALNDTALWILLLHAFLWLLILLRERAQWDKRTVALALAAGIALGISALARALLPSLALLALPCFALRLGWRGALLRMLPVAIASLLVVLPWLLRGAAIYGGFVPIALNSGENIYQGNHPHTTAILRAGYDVQWLGAPLAAPPRDQGLARNAFLSQAGWNYLRDNPAQIPQLLLTKLLVHWNPQVTPLNNLRQGERLTIDENGRVYIVAGGESHVGVTRANAAYQDDSLFAVLGRGIHLLYFGALWLLAIVGAWQRQRGWRSLSLLYAVQLSQTLMYLLFHPSTRYRSPTDPLLFVFSALAIAHFAARWRENRRKAGRVDALPPPQTPPPK